jgi:radical SAM/Cys-rich protein
MREVLPLLNKSVKFPPIRRRSVSTLQVNLGYLCNQSCVHCHVNAGPNRTEMMSAEVISDIESLIDTGRIKLLDLTGGAPELSLFFKRIVRFARARGVDVIDRCNLTILFEPGQEGLAEFLAEQGVKVTASLPCYLEDNVDKQRGDGVFQKSIDGIKQLNALGFGLPGSTLTLDLVYNPQGPALPPPQEALEADYKRELGSRYGISFSHLFTITNMPIQRFGSTLLSKGQFDGYMTTLQGAHSVQNLQTVMCRDLVSIDWQGFVYDCDFNQMLGLAARLPADFHGPRLHVRDLLTRLLTDAPIVVRDHCFGCTAGQGSSCGGALDAAAPDTRDTKSEGIAA